MKAHTRIKKIKPLEVVVIVVHEDLYVVKGIQHQLINKSEKKKKKFPYGCTCKNKCKYYNAKIRKEKGEINMPRLLTILIVEIKS